MVRSLLRESQMVDLDVLTEAEHDALSHYFVALADVTTYSGNSGKYVVVNNTATGLEYVSSTTDSGTLSYVKVSDVKSSGVNGGTFTQDVWQTRNLNTKDSDTDNICSLSNNQITLDQGTYECRITSPACNVNHHKIKLRNVTDSSDIIIGTSEYTNNNYNISTNSFICGRFTVEVNKALEVQHRCNTTGNNSGFGVASIFGINEIYTTAEFWKII